MTLTPSHALRSICICLALVGCSPRPPATQAANTPSGFPTLSAPPSEAPATSTQPAQGTATGLGTPVPTVVVQPQAYPIPVMGTGEMQVDVQKWEGPALLHAKYPGRDDFTVQSARGGSGPLPTLKTLINAIGPYEGIVPLDFEPGRPTTQLMIKAAGPWVLEIQPLASAKPYQVPTTVNGKGDDVILLSGSTPGTVMAIATGRGTFTVTAYTRSGDTQALVSEGAPYTGVAAMAADVYALAVHGTGSWSLQISAK